MSEEPGNSLFASKMSTGRDDAGSVTTSPNESPRKNSEPERQRKVSAAHQQPDLTTLKPQERHIHGGTNASTNAGANAGAAASGGGASDFFRPRAGSDSRAPSVLGKMASMTRTRWRSGEGQALQQGHQPVPGVSQTIHGGSDAPVGTKNRSVFDIFPKNFRPRSKSDAAGKMKRPKGGASETGRQSGSSTPRGRGEHGRSPPPTPVGGSVTPGASGAAPSGYLPNAASPYTTYHGGMFSGPQRGPKGTQGRDLSYLFADPRALLAQDRRSRLSLHGFSERYELENVADNLVFVKFMKSHRCHDLIPDGYNNKLIVFDTQLKVQKAFFALMEHGIRAAPLWDSIAQDFVGMLTISDFITILTKYYRSPLSSKNDIKSHVISTWRDVLKHHNERIATNKLVSIGPDSSLYDGIKMLHESKIHRLAVMDAWSGNVIQILTHKRLLRFLFQFNHELPRPSFVFKSIQELGVGTYENILMVNPETPLIQALNRFNKNRVSALPVVDEDGRLVDIYARYDTIKLASNQTYNNLDITIRQALQYGNDKGISGPYTCRKEESLQKVMERIVRCNVHRLVIVDEECRVEGIISLSDIVVYIVLRQEELFAEEQRLEELKQQRQQSSDEGINVSVEGVDSASAASDSSEASVKEKHSATSSSDAAANSVSGSRNGVTLSRTLSSPTSTATNAPHTFSGTNTPPTPHSKSPSPGGGGGEKERPALKLFVPPTSAPPLSHHQHQQRLLQHQQKHGSASFHRNGDGRHTPPPTGNLGGGGASGLEKTPSPMRETYNPPYPRSRSGAGALPPSSLSSSASSSEDSMATSVRMMTPPPSTAKGKKLSTPLRKKSIVDEIIPEFPTAIDLNVPELV